MRIGRFSVTGQPRIGCFDEDTVENITSTFDSFSNALARPEAASDAEADESFDHSEITYFPPTTRRNTVFWATLNYEAHAEESERAVPEHP